MYPRTTWRWALALALTGVVACEFPTRPADPASRLAVSPKVLTLHQYQVADFTAVGLTNTGDTAAVAVRWSVTSGAIIDTSTTSGRHHGRYRAGSDTGKVKIVARGGGSADTAVVTVTPAPVAMVVMSSAAASVVAGQTVQLTATPEDSSGNPLSGRVVTWVSSNSGVATVNSNGLVSGVVAGAATVTAVCEGQSGAVAITVTAVPVASVAVDPTSASVSVGLSQQLTATPRDANGIALTGRAVTWATSNAAVATVNGNGLVTGAAGGTATITASSEGQSGTSAITVIAPVASVTVSPAAAALLVGQTAQLTATPKDANGSPLSGRAVAWASSAPAVATISANGLVTGVAAGTATLTATCEGQNGTATVTVTIVPVASVTVSPASSSLLVGQTAQLAVTTKDSAGNVLSGRTITWATSSATVATVSTTGLVTAKAAGSATITATSEGKSGTATVTVTVAPVASVAVSPSSSSLQLGGTVQLSATLKDAAGNVLTGRVVTWASSAPAVTVSASGLVTGVAAGSATITATSESKSGSAAITVSSTVLQHSGHYVTTGGTTGGDGSASQPWTLSYALGGAGGRVGPGDTVWVRGGTYYAPFRSTLTGTAAAPIVVRAYPGERPIIDGVNATGDNFVVAGSWSVMWGLEFTNTAPSRYTDLINNDYRPNIVINNGPHNKYVNLVIHDGGVAFYNYSAQFDVEIYGSIVYNNGWQAPDRGHGHGMYLKSDVGPIVARDNVIFNQYGYGIHVYTDLGSGLLNNIHLEGNVSFDNGSLSPTGPSANLGNLGQPLANTLGVLDNMTYFAPSLSGSNVTLGSGDGLTATGNYVVGGAGISEGTWTNATVTGNTVLSATASAPTRVFVRPNRYELGRANIIVYNPSGQGSVTVDLSGVVPAGVRYEVRNVQDLFGAPVASGTGGGAVSLPMSGVAPPTPVGMSSSAAPTTGPYFNVFVVTIISQ